MPVTRTGRSSLNADRRYRIDRPTLMTILRDLRIPPTHPGPGDRIAHFDLVTTDGRPFSNRTMAERGRRLVLFFGSLTCPVAESAGPEMVELHRRYGHAVDFVAVYVREAHPGADLRQPRLAEDKLRNACRFRNHHGFEFPVAVDDIDGTMHRSFGTRPSSAYLLDPQGVILFRAHWSNRVGALENALRAVIAGQTPPRTASGQTVRALTRMVGHADVPLQTAGRGALVDFWFAAPPVAAVLTLSRIWHGIRARRRGR